LVEAERWRSIHRHVQAVADASLADGCRDTKTHYHDVERKIPDILRTGIVQV
jgi:hypothetical protein